VVVGGFKKATLNAKQVTGKSVYEEIISWPGVVDCNAKDVLKRDHDTFTIATRKDQKDEVFTCVLELTEELNRMRYRHELKPEQVGDRMFLPIVHAKK
jgi:hypothetical protein